MDEIHLIEEVLGIPHHSNCPPGLEWYQNPRNVAKLRCIANVTKYIRAEFGIESEEEKAKILQFLTDLHAAFGYRVGLGEKLGVIALPAEVMQDYIAEIGGRIPAEAFVEGMRKEFERAEQGG